MQPSQSVLALSSFEDDAQLVREALLAGSARALLGLARHPQVYVKASAFFRVSAEAYPYADAQRCVRALVDAFGAERVMFGSDWPVSRAVGEGRAAAGSETDPARKSG